MRCRRHWQLNLIGKMATQPKHDPPHGMEPFDLGSPGDLGALSTEQQEKLNKFKVIWWFWLQDATLNLMPT